MLSLLFPIAAASRAGGLAFGWLDILSIIIVSDITHSFDHDISSSISQLIKINHKDSKKYSNILMEQQILCLMYYHFQVLFLFAFCFLFFCLIFKRFTCYCFLAFDLNIFSIVFIRIIIYFISIIIAKTFWCHGIIVAIFLTDYTMA